VTSDLGFPILTVIVFVPLAGAAVTASLPRTRSEQLAKVVGAVTMAVEIALVATLVVEFKTRTAGFQFVSNQPWLPGFGIRWFIGVDGISLFLLAITALLFPIALLGPKVAGGAKSFVAWMLFLEAACMLTFVSLDLFLFFVAFEVTLVPGYFLIAGFGGLRRNYAAMKFFVYTFAGSAFLFVAILAMVFLVGRYDGHDSFSLITLTRWAGHLPIADQEWIFIGLFLGFAVKIPLVPFHSWLPDAYTEAPTSASMVLAGILFKLGAYGLLRFGIFMLPQAATRLAPLLLTLAVIGITYGAVVTIMQRDFKRLIAYASIVDVAFIVVGIFAFSAQSITGGVFEMVNHGLTTGALFFLVGMIWERCHTYRISDLGGLQKSAPILSVVMIVVIMSAIGLPGLNGFVGEFLVLVGTFLTDRWWAVIATSAVVTGAIYMLWAYQRVFHGRAVGTNATIADISLREAAAIAPLLAGMVFLGVYPTPFLNRITPSVDHLLSHVELASGLHVPAAGNPRVTYTVPAAQRVDLPRSVLASDTGHGGRSPAGGRDLAAMTSTDGGRP
jgi:NADH-quinone oxidoreductase subunit M